MACKSHLYMPWASDGLCMCCDNMHQNLGSITCHALVSLTSWHEVAFISGAVLILSQESASWCAWTNCKEHHLHTMENLYQQGLQEGDLQLCSMSSHQLAGEQALPGCKISLQHLLAAACQSLSHKWQPWMPSQTSRLATSPACTAQAVSASG